MQTWKIGDMVLLEDEKVKPHFNVVICHKLFNTGPFFIADIIKGQQDIGLRID